MYPHNSFTFASEERIFARANILRITGDFADVVFQLSRVVHAISSLTVIQAKLNMAGFVEIDVSRTIESSTQ